MISRKVFPAINDLIYGITARIDISLRAGIVFVNCLLIGAIFFFDLGYFDNPKYTMLYGTALTLVITFFCVNEGHGDIRINRTIAWPLWAFGVSVIIASFTHYIGAGYVVNALDLVIVFPLLYYVTINGNTKNMLIKMISLSVSLEGLIAYILCAVLSFKGTLMVTGDDRVSGYTENPNYIGALGLVMIMSGLYLLLEKNKPFLISCITAVDIGGGWFFMLASTCRAALLASAGCIFAFGVFKIKDRQQRERTRINWIKGLTVFAILLSTFLFGMKMNDINQYYSLKNATSSTNNSQKAQIEAKDEFENLKDRLNSDQNINDYSSGRIEIWTVYIDNFSLTGKETAEIADIFTVDEWRAHNNIIDYTYRCGYISGALYALFYISVGIEGLKLLFSKKSSSPEDFFVVEAIGCYALYSMVEIATLSFFRCIVCIFFMAIPSIIFKKHGE